MTDGEELHPWADLPGPWKSIFPLFDVGVPMPADTAIPGSYRAPVRAPDAAEVQPATPGNTPR
jgi:hypothetical protein